MNPIRHAPFEDILAGNKGKEDLVFPHIPIVVLGIEFLLKSFVTVKLKVKHSYLLKLKRAAKGRLRFIDLLFV